MWLLTTAINITFTWMDTIIWLSASNYPAIQLCSLHGCCSNSITNFKNFLVVLCNQVIWHMNGYHHLTHHLEKPWIQLCMTIVAIVCHMRLDNLHSYKYYIVLCNLVMWHIDGCHHLPRHLQLPCNPTFHDCRGSSRPMSDTVRFNNFHRMLRNIMWFEWSGVITGITIEILMSNNPDFYCFDNNRLWGTA